MRRHGLSPFVLYKAGINQTRHALITPFLRKQARIHHCAKLFRKKGKKSKGINLHKSMKYKLMRVPMRGKFTAESTRTQYFKLIWRTENCLWHINSVYLTHRWIEQFLFASGKVRKSELKAFYERVSIVVDNLRTNRKAALLDNLTT